MVTAEQRRIFQILEEMETLKEKFGERNYTWLCRKKDPKYDDILTHFISYEEMNTQFKRWKKIGHLDKDELPKASDDDVDTGLMETEEQKQSIDMNKIASFLLGREDVQTNAEEVDKLKMLLDNTSKTGNAYLSMMAYKQMERVGNLMTALEIAEKRMYSPDVIESISVTGLTNLIDNINKTMKFALEFVDKTANREQRERALGTHITINQASIAENMTVTTPTSSLSKPEREKLRIMAMKLLNPPKL